MKRPAYWVRPAAAGLFAVVCMLALPVGARGQVSLSTGDSLYDADEFCLESGAFLTSFQAGIRGGIIGGSVSYSSSWPWPDPPGGGNEDRIDGPIRFGGASFQEAVYLSQGEAARAVVEVFALPLLDRLTGGDGELSQIDRRISPFVGVGIQYSTDGDPAPVGGGRDVVTYGVKGATELLLVAGANLIVPVSDQLGLLLQVRGNRLQAGDVEFLLPEGETVTASAGARNWVEFLAGFSFELGG